MPSPTALPIGEEVDRYIVEAQLGEGGVAVVYRVRHRMLHSLHALKLLKHASPEQRQRLAAEGRAQAALRHPNIVRVTDVVERGEALGLIVDYVAGPTLEERLAQGPLPLSEAISIGRGIIEGVAAAHAAGIVHRDLKPANVLLTRSPSGAWQPHVADFGIAKALDTTNGPTRAGLGMGTPGYMAPEQYHNAAGVDHRADIFSLGCLLYELVCGRPPFLGDSVVEVFQLAARGDYPFPQDLRPELPLRLAHALEEALAPVPDRRFADCAELLSAWGSEADPDAGSSIAAAPAPAAGEDTFDFDAPAAPSPTSTPSRRYGDYVIDEKLGQGGMGVVWRAHPVDMKRTVALKTISVAHEDRTEARARFVREISALGRCSHPNIVRIFHHGEDHGQLYYVMEFIEGTNLQQISGPLVDPRHSAPGIRPPEGPAAAPGPIPSIQEGAALFAAAAEGLHHLHEHGVVHRDIKPANLMLTAGGDRLVVTDLGLAQLSDASRALTGMEVKVLGTLRYMPPEQLQRNLLEVDHRVDIYALAATFTEVLTGAPLFDGDTEQRVIQQVLHEAPPSARLLNPDIPANLELVLQKAMAKRPEHRYPTAAAFAADLRAVAEDRPVSVRRPSITQRLRRAMGRSPVAAAVLLTCLVMGGATSAVGLAMLGLGERFDEDRARSYARVVQVGRRWQGRDWIPDRDWIDPVTAGIARFLGGSGSWAPVLRSLDRDPDAPHVQVSRTDGLPSELEWRGPEGAPSKLRGGAHRISQAFHRNGELSEVVYRARDGTVLWREHHEVTDQSDEGSTIVQRFVDAEHQPLADPATGVFRQEWTIPHDSSGTKRVRFLSLEGTPAHSRTGVWDQRSFSSPDGATSTTAWFGPSGAPTPGPDGVEQVVEYYRIACPDLLSAWPRCDARSSHQGSQPALDRTGSHATYTAKRHHLTIGRLLTPLPEPTRAALRAAVPELSPVSFVGDLELNAVLQLDSASEPSLDQAGVLVHTTLRDSRGRALVRIHADAEGRPQPNLDGIAVHRTRHHDDGSEVHSYLDAAGQLTPSRTGVATTTIDRSDDATTRQSWFGPDASTPIAGPSGAPVVEVDHEQGLIRRRRYLSADGSPTENTDGIHIVAYDYDAEGRQISESYLDAQLQPVVHSTLGYATRHRVFDRLGRVVETTLLDQHGQLATREWGPARWATEHDAAGRPVRHTSLSITRTPTPCAGGYTVETVEYTDERADDTWQRDVTTHRYWQVDQGELRPAVTSRGFARRVVFTDAAGRVLEERSFDAEGAAVAGDRGCPRTVLDRDRWGRATAERCLDGAGRPSTTAEGVARLERTHDRFGRPVEERWLDSAGALTTGPDGAARRVYRYGAEDAPTETQDFDASGAAVLPEAESPLPESTGGVP